MWSSLTCRLTGIQRRIHLANLEMSYFNTKTWVFRNDNFLRLRKMLPSCDSKHFQLDRIETLDFTSSYKDLLLGGRLYLLNEGTDTLPHARRHYIR